MSCFAESVEGASSIRSRASLFFGKQIVSLIDSTPSMIWMSRSSPHAIPPCGGAPNLSASSRKPNFSLCSFLSIPRTSKTFDWMFSSWILIEPPPISVPFRTMSYAIDFDVSGSLLNDFISGWVNGWWVAIIFSLPFDLSNAGKSVTQQNANSFGSSLFFLRSGRSMLYFFIDSS